MRLKRLAVRNFRNLRDIDIPLEPGTVIVGENRAGKSNLLHAVRLVLDASLPNSDRYLSVEDFSEELSDGDRDPMKQGEVIEVIVEFTDFEDDALPLTAISEALVEGDPTTGRLTYRFAPRDLPEGEEASITSYRWQILGGSEPTQESISSDLRGYLHMAFLGALRDAERDLGVWRRSPLRPLLEKAAGGASSDELSKAKRAIENANEVLTTLAGVGDLADEITEKTDTMVGRNQSLDITLGTGPANPLRLLRTLRLFVDGGARRPLTSTSLGALNVLYLALLELDLDARIDDHDLAHLVLAIEEPEAHLHPHLQRLVFRRLLRPDDTRSVLLTTHSPHVASVGPARSLVVLRGDGRATTAFAAANADLEDADWDDIERYLDATRAELVFARGVLFVEGFAEQVLVPRLARTIKIDLDKRGVTVCAIHGTHFEAYVRFAQALGIRWAVVTDGDPDEDGDLAGEARARGLLEALGQDEDNDPTDYGIFVGATTFEYDVYTASDENKTMCRSGLSSLAKTPTQKTIEGWATTEPDVPGYLRVIENVGGKGRAAQQLSLKKLQPPDYVAEAIRHVARTPSTE